MAESKEELKTLLLKVGLQFNIQKIKIMAFSLITSWQIDGETVETVAEFIFLGSKITADGDCSNEIKRHLENALEEKQRPLVSCQSQRKAMPKNAQTTAQLHSSHTLVK